jgi:putative ABC transport system substrate-binding protein
MQRRTFITLLAGAAGSPIAGRAQQKAIPVIGILGGTSAGPYAPFVTSFLQALGESGYFDARNVALEYRWAEGRFARLPTLASELVDRKVDLILAIGGTISALAAKRATSTIPIVFVNGGEPVADGLVASLARPGGNLTGVTFIAKELNGKRLELLSELVPPGQGNCAFGEPRGFEC